MGYLVQYRKNNLKNTAIGMRKRGLSYSEIRKTISVSKSTLSRWFRGISLTDFQLKKLQERRRLAGERGSRTRKLKTQTEIQKIKKISAENICKISPREFWLMGVVLYWRERFTSDRNPDTKQGVCFSSSNPHLIFFFLKWLREIGKLSKDEIKFSIFISRSKKDLLPKAIHYWSVITGFPEENFSRYYLQSDNKKLVDEQELIKPLNPDTNSQSSKDTGEVIEEKHSTLIQNQKMKKPVKGAKFGFLQIRVKASSMLARQISGWIDGIISFL